MADENAQDPLSDFDPIGDKAKAAAAAAAALAAQKTPAEGKVPGVGPMTVGPAEAPPASAAAPAPTAAPTADDIMLQHLGQGSGATAGLNMDPETAGAIPAVPSQLGHDIFHPTDASPGPQTWRDWVTKTYHPEATDYLRAFGSGATYGLDPQARNLANVGWGAVTGSPLPYNISGQGAREANEEAFNRLGPMGPVTAGLGMYMSPITRFGVAPLGDKAWELTKTARDALGPLAEKYLPDAVTDAAAKVAPYVPEALPQKLASGVTQAGTTGAIQGAGNADSPDMVLPDMLSGFKNAAPYGAVNMVLPGGTVPSQVSSADAAESASKSLAALKFNTGDIKRTAEGAMSQASGGPPQEFDYTAAPKSNALMGPLTQGTPQTGQSLVNLRDQFQVIARDAKDPQSAEYKYATAYGNAIDNVLRNKAPLNPNDPTGRTFAPQETGTAGITSDVLTGVRNLNRPGAPAPSGDAQLATWLKEAAPASGATAIGSHFLGHDPVLTGGLGLAATIAPPIVRGGINTARWLADTAARQQAVQMPYYRLMTNRNPVEQTIGQGLFRALLAAHGY